MSVDEKKDPLVEEIELFIQYAVAENETEQAIALVDNYRNNPLILKLMREYYSTLPEAREEPVVLISRLLVHQGVCLFVASTPSFAYLYVVSTDHILLLGEYRQEVKSEVLSFFGFDSQDSFLKTCPAVAELEPYDDSGDRSQVTCPACGAIEEEYHILGCAVEVCPWCDGQLSKCNCRFEQLDTDEITTEEQLEEFVDLLTAKGRIPYRKNQAPAYPGTSDGLDANRS